MQVLISVSKITVRCAGSHLEHIIAQPVAYAASVLIITVLGYVSSSIQFSIDHPFISARKLRNHWPTKSFPVLACLDVCHRTPRQPANLASLEESRCRRADSILCGRLGNVHLVESPVLLDFLWWPCRTLGCRHPARLPCATGASHRRTVMVKWVCRCPATRPRSNTGRFCNPDLDICRCA